MTWRNGLVIAGIVVIAALLAFPMRLIVYQMIVIPLAYLLWLLKLFYLALGQASWWILLAGITAMILALSLIPEIKPVREILLPKRPERGRVETLSVELGRASKGVYFKWLVANRLGKLAYQLLLQREHGKPRPVFAPLTGEGWDAQPGVQQYLEKGLQGSFADFPTSQWSYFTKPEKTPLDYDIHEVVEFLEEKFEK